MVFFRLFSRLRNLGADFSGSPEEGFPVTPAGLLGRRRVGCLDSRSRGNDDAI